MTTHETEQPLHRTSPPTPHSREGGDGREALSPRIGPRCTNSLGANRSGFARLAVLRLRIAVQQDARSSLRGWRDALQPVTARHVMESQPSGAIEAQHDRRYSYFMNVSATIGE
jgi:hypothetical protein